MAQLPVLAPYAASLGAGALFTGVILGSYSLVNMTGNLLAGPVIDAYDRRVTIVAGLLTAGLAVAGYAVVTHPWQLLLVRLVHGAGGAVLIPAVFAWAGDRSRSGAVGRSMGYAGAAVAVAATVGPALGGVGGARLGPERVFLFLGALLWTTALIVIATGYRELFTRRGVRDAAPGAEADPGTAARPDPAIRPLSAILEVLRHPALAGAYRAVLGLTFAMGTLAYTLPITMRDLGFSTSYTGMLFSSFSIAAILVMLLPTNRLPDRYGPLRVAQAGLLVVALSLATLVGAFTLPFLAVTIVFYGLAFGLVFPATTTIVVNTAGRDRRGTAFGVYYAFYSLGVFVGPILAGFTASLGVSPYWNAVAVIAVTQLLEVRSNSRVADDPGY